MESKTIDPHPLGVLSEWLRIGQKSFGELHKLTEIWNPLMEAGHRYRPDSRRRVPKVMKLVESLSTVCQQSLYAIGRITFYATQEPSNVFEFYVANYLTDFIIRVKSATDILALLMNELYGLGLPDTSCSLENGQLVSALRRGTLDDPDTSQMARLIDSKRSGWIDSLDQLRDHVIHKAGLQFIAVGMEQHRIHVSLQLPEDLPEDVPIFADSTNPYETLKKWKGIDPLTDFLAHTKSASLTKYQITVDPVVLCDEIWALLRSAINEILGRCSRRILELIRVEADLK
jgi:hypothetical protein